MKTFQLPSMVAPKLSPLYTESKPEELSLADKVMLANHPSVQEYIREELEAQSKALFSTLEDWEHQINVMAQETAQRMTLNHLNFYIVLHNSDDRRFVVKGGTQVEIHYFGKADDFMAKRFWKNALPKILLDINRLRLQTSSTLVPVKKIRQWRLSDGLQILKVEKLGVEDIAPLIPLNQITVRESIDIEITMTYKEHSVTVSGPFFHANALHNKAQVLLSRKVHEQSI